ncbi:selenite/tellurite reduction operon protein ExtJ [Trichloromonas sp.]|uniref:selenite/tellurite reduction operon protein ExtJ n=1 Tax=Trichloromonas sp. TaxID=3069249 RepID=UPI003D817F10
MKKSIALIAAALMFVSLSGFAFAEEFEGTVTKVKGQLVTIEITKGKAADIAVDSNVKIELQEAAKAPKKAGGSMLQGC